DNTLAVKSLMGSFPPPYKLPDDLPHKPLRVETNLRFAQFPLAGNIFGSIFTEAEPVLITDSVKDPRVYMNGPEDFLRCGSYIFAPIKQQDKMLGLVGLARTAENEKFTKDEFDTAVIIADAISTAITPLYSFLAYAEHTELSKDGTIASKYQKDLLPAKLPVIPNVSIGCFSNAMEGVCGDYYDVIASRKDRISFIMSDVAGKGMNSLVVMIMIRAILRLTVNTEQSAATILSWANRGICIDSAKIDHFASVALINFDSTSNKAQISTCGNNPVFHFSAATNEFTQVSTPSEPMGVEKNTVYSDIDLNLAAGDILITCTDGLLESLNENGVQYSLENLKRVILKNKSAPAKDISNRVKDDLKKYCGNAQQYDDQSILLIKIQ
ncbi:MAG: SpoIIE family protein phosphatase, partial [Treponema sp.]|nr:SpoIIE family protein phosphatase [Treponema sp.]